MTNFTCEQIVQELSMGLSVLAILIFTYWMGYFFGKHSNNKKEGKWK